MTTRAELQGKTLDDLRTIAASVGVETDGLQKAKLIAAILDSGEFEVTEEPAELELPTAEKKTASNGEKQKSRSGGERRNENGGQQRRRRPVAADAARAGATVGSSGGRVSGGDW